ncbi:MAG TPA: hypothetical protein IAB32_06770 [Candidatus Scatosoma pullicola]|nr:hypothetical protein [Candidatus Scatosoma pullicola]
MRKNLLPIAAVIFVCAVLLISAGMLFFSSAPPLSALPSPTVLPVFHFG